MTRWRNSQRVSTNPSVSLFKIFDIVWPNVDPRRYCRERSENEDAVLIYGLP